MLRRKKLKTYQYIFITLGLILFLLLMVQLLVEMFWFEEVHFLSVFFKTLFWQLSLGFVVFALSWWFLLKNLQLAQQWQWPFHLESAKVSAPLSATIHLPWLLLVCSLMSIWIGLILIHFAQITHAVWFANYSLPNVKFALSSPIAFFWIVQKVESVISDPRKLGFIIALVSLLLLKPTLTLKIVAFLLSLIASLFIAENWEIVLKNFYATPFGQVDLQFNQDLSFFIFGIPFWQILEVWLEGVCVFALFAVSLTYLLSADSLSQGKFPGFSQQQIRHLCALAGGLMCILILRHILERYQLVYSPVGVVYGASYTDIHVQQYVEIALAILSGMSSFWFFRRAFVDYYSPRLSIPLGTFAKRYYLPFYFIPIILYFIVSASGFVLTNFTQTIIVEPNELELEKKYIERNITATRAAFALDQIEAKIFNPNGQLTLEKLKENALTINNIRLWDTYPLLEANRQLQQIRLYYRFPDADIDRYMMEIQDNLADFQPIKQNETSDKQQIIISGRELDYSLVPDTAKTWINEHLVYTHGYGFTLSPVNEVDRGGLPYYFVKNIGTNQEPGALQTSNRLVQDTISIGKPRIYYGESTNTYVMTATQVKEFDFPSGEDNVYNIYDGTGGISIGSAWKRLLFSAYLRDWQMLFTNYFTPDTKLLFRRDIVSRVKAIAPFLNYDNNPYLVAADIDNEVEHSKLFWILDGYTVSDHYPYSDPGENKINYIRNSVKAVIDAYNGDVHFYISDPQEPMIRTWQKIFPELFRSIAEMPQNLQAHIRYPEDFYEIQSKQLLTFHMIDPQVFYNREDQWQIPQEIYGNQPQNVEPYYLIMRLPDATSEEFILLQPYTPKSRPNLIAWLAARSDAPYYGKLLLYQFPKQQLLYGPQQLEALINQDPDISQQISLWNRDGSRVLQGNLLIIPIEKSLLYVEPIYIVAEQNGVPTLARVVVFYDNKIVMAQTLREGLQKMFGGQAKTINDLS